MEIERKMNHHDTCKERSECNNCVWRTYTFVSTVVSQWSSLHIISHNIIFSTPHIHLHTHWLFKYRFPISKHLLLFSQVLEREWEHTTYHPPSSSSSVWSCSFLQTLKLEHFRDYFEKPSASTATFSRVSQTRNRKNSLESKTNSSFRTFRL